MRFMVETVYNSALAEINPAIQSSNQRPYCNEAVHKNRCIKMSRTINVFGLH